MVLRIMVTIRYLDIHGTELIVFVELLVQMLKRSSISGDERSVLLADLFRNIKKDTAKESLYWHIKMTMFLAVAEREG